MDLTDKVAIVTGASSGLGLDFSRALVERGAHVFGFARSTDTLNSIRDDLGEHFHPVTCDVRNEDEVNASFDTVLDEGGRLDVLINNAGLGKFDPVDELSPDEWNVQMDTNLTGVFHCTRKAIAPMRKQNDATGFGGHIINIASIAGLVGNPNLSAYNATKYGLRGFSDAVMKEVRTDGIRVSCVYPGSIQTNFANVADSGIADNPLQPEDVTGVVIHLLEAPDNCLISEVVMRPLRPRG